MVASSLNDLTGSSGYVTISWTGLTPRVDHYAYRVYHRSAGAVAWTLLTENQGGTGTGSYDVYQFANGGTQELTLVETTIDINGYLTELSFANANSFTPTGDAKYWLVHPTNSSLTMMLPIVTSDSYTEEVEHQAIQLLGRGRKINLGERYGVTGSLSMMLIGNANDSAREQRVAFQALVGSGSNLFLRNPFGDLWNVWIGNPSYDRVATGSTETMNVSFDYTEVG